MILASMVRGDSPNVKLSFFFQILLDTLETDFSSTLYIEFVAGSPTILFVSQGWSNFRINLFAFKEPKVSSRLPGIMFTPPFDFVMPLRDPKNLQKNEGFKFLFALKRWGPTKP